MQTQYDLLSQPGDTKLNLPRLPASYFLGVESLSRLSPGEDKYLLPPPSFGAIDSIAIVGDVAYLFQITQDRQHKISEFLLAVLAYLPEHLHVEFIWVFPLGMWKKVKFKQRQLPDLTAYLEEDSVQKAAPQQRHARMVASNQKLVAKRLRECEEQYKIPVVPFRELTAEQPVQGKQRNQRRQRGQRKQTKQTAAETSLRTAVGFDGAAVRSVRCPSQVKTASHGCINECGFKIDLRGSCMSWA